MKTMINFFCCIFWLLWAFAIRSTHKVCVRIETWVCICQRRNSSSWSKFCRNSCCAVIFKQDKRFARVSQCVFFLLLSNSQTWITNRNSNECFFDLVYALFFFSIGYFWNKLITFKTPFECTTDFKPWCGWHYSNISHWFSEDLLGFVTRAKSFSSFFRWWTCIFRMPIISGMSTTVDKKNTHRIGVHLSRSARHHFQWSQFYYSIPFFFFRIIRISYGFNFFGWSLLLSSDFCSVHWKK